ncbi:S-phase kinase-associated protein 1 [Coccomyxa sp. Obi]|nr:S-phase kinase-associated protein 1 [Coccomyxa sp. Obi]
MRTVILRSSDGADHVVSSEAACLSRTVQSLLEELEAKEGEESPLIVPLPNVCDCTLRKVLQYCIQHSESGTNLTGRINASDATRRDMEVWDRNYMLVNTDELYHLVMAAHYLNVPGLLELCCEGIANLIRGKSPQHVRQHFGLVNNFEQAEEEDIRRTNLWALVDEKELAKK